MNIDYIFMFAPNERAKDLGIGDLLLIGHSYDEFYLYKTGEPKCSDKQILKRNPVIDEYIDKLASQNTNYIIWDDNECINGIVGHTFTIMAITKDFILVSPVEEETKDCLLNNILKEAPVEEIDETYMPKHTHGLGDFLSIDEMPSMTCRNKECSMERKEEEKEETGMFSELGSSFGKIHSNQFRLSINGLTVRGRDGKYLTFNPETRELVEVTAGFFDDMDDLLFLMPTTELEAGDIILHQNKPYYITQVNSNNVKGVDFEEAVENTLIPKTNVFGMKYYTKVFNCLGTNNILGADIASNPAMAYALMGGKDFDISKVMMFQALSGQKGIADFSDNPVMLMALMSNEKGGDLGNFAKMQILSQLSKKKNKTEDREEN